MSTLPVSVSTSTSTMLPPNVDPTPVLFVETAQVIGPPVRRSRPANCRKVMRSAGFFAQVKTPCWNSTSSGCTSQIRAARAIICRLTSSAAAMAARPVS